MKKHQAGSFIALAIVAVMGVGCSTTRTSSWLAASDDAAECDVNLVRNLIRKSPGVQVIEGPDRVRLRIRGSLRDPLYVVDGLPVDGRMGDLLSSLNPCDVEDIRVLSNLADLSNYGIRGGGGVVVITTRRPTGSSAK